MPELNKDDIIFLYNFWTAAKNKLPSHTYYGLITDATNKNEIPETLKNRG